MKAALTWNNNTVLKSQMTVSQRNGMIYGNREKDCIAAYKGKIKS